MQVSSTVRKWSAGLALFAIVASGVGLAVVLIVGSMSASKPSERAVAPRTALVPRQPKVPTPVEFAIRVIVTDQTCVSDTACSYKYTIEPKYIGMHPLPETPITVFYEVFGGTAPQKGEFTVHKDQAQIRKDVILEGPPGAQLKAHVMSVAG